MLFMSSPYLELHKKIVLSFVLGNRNLNLSFGLPGLIPYESLSKEKDQVK